MCIITAYCFHLLYHEAIQCIMYFFSIASVLMSSLNSVENSIFYVSSFIMLGLLTSFIVIDNYIIHNIFEHMSNYSLG